MFKDGFALIIIVVLLAWHCYDPLPDPKSPDLNIDGITLGMDRREAETALGLPLKPFRYGAWNSLMGTQVLFDSQERVKAVRGDHLGLGDWRLLEVHDSFATMLTRLGPYQSVSSESSSILPDDAQPGGSRRICTRYWFRYPDRRNTPHRRLEVRTRAVATRGASGDSLNLNQSCIDEFSLEQNAE